MSPYSYYLQWKRESNPWKEAYRAEVSSRGTFLCRFLLFLFIFAALNVSGQRIGRQRGAVSPLSSRPTVLAGTFHAFTTSAISIYLLAATPLLLNERSSNNGSSASAETPLLQLHDWSLWQKVAIPLSLAYFAADAIWYCLPRSDGLIFFHHVIMCFCHYPVVNDAGAALAGAGDGRFAIWLSIVGYTSEVSTCLMNYRWYLIETLEGNWVGFSLVNMLVVLSWAYRIILFAYLLVWEIIPRTSLYVEKKQLLTFIIMFMGHAIIGLLSLYWLRIMCRGGLKSLLTFNKKKKNKCADNGSAVTFSFGDDIGRDTCSRDSSSERKGKKSTYSPLHIVQTGIDEAKGWVDGTLFLNREKTA